LSLTVATHVKPAKMAQIQIKEGEYTSTIYGMVMYTQSLHLINPLTFRFAGVTIN